MDIFISYLREDIEAAEKLAEALQAYGWSVFWDRRIPAGKRFDDFLDEQLHAARCVVVLWSRGSINSPWVKDEAAVGRDRGILVPARLDDVLAPFGFRAIQAANLIGWQDDRSQSGFQQLLRDIRAAIEVPARVFAAGMGEPSPLISQPEEAESKQQAEEKERPRRDQAEAVSKRRAEEEEQQRREQKQAEAKRRAAEDEQRQQAEDKHKFEEQAQLKPEATDERTAHKKSSSFVGFVALAIVLLVFGLAAYTTNWFGQPGDDQATTHHAVQGHSEGPGALDQYRLGIIHRDGIDVPQDDTEAVKWFRKAADQGNSDAQNKLGVMYQAGRGVPQDDAEAVKWFHKAADQGNSDAQYNLAVMYQSGRGVLRDDAAAVKWCRKAADQGNAWAQSNLGLMYENGRGVAQDDVEAVKWYRKAADQRNVWAQNNLGLMYDNGRGVTKDDTEAVKWYRKAADQGYATAQYNLGLMYENGRGVPQDDAEAVKWYRKAADQEDTDAREALLRYGEVSGKPGNTPGSVPHVTSLESRAAKRATKPSPHPVEQWTIRR